MQLVVTASATLSGQPLYRTPQGQWSPTAAEAELFNDPASAQPALHAARAEEADVCDPYVVEAQRDADALVFATLKERIRASGPTVAIL